MPGDAAVDVGVRTTSLRLDVRGQGMSGCATIAAEVFWSPEHLRTEPIAVFCFPGGGMSRRYFDLSVAGYSMARHLARQGFLVFTVDHPGIGESDVPADAWSLTPDAVADIDAAGATDAIERLAKGELDGLPPTQPALVIGLGHSAGAHVLLHQQQRRSLYDAVALFGWSGRGLPERLDEGGQRLAWQSELRPSELIEAARARNEDALVDLPRGQMDFLVANRPDADVHAALVAARTRLLAVVGYASMIPGSAAHCAASVIVPVFLATGERDIAREPRQAPQDFPQADDITVFVLADTGHNHHVEPTRLLLWDRFAAWAGSLRPS